MRRVKLVTPQFEAEFETDGVISRADPAIEYLVGWSDDDAREFFESKGWMATIVAGPTRIILHWESYEVHRDGKRKMFFFDTNAFRRGVSGRVSKETARQEALAYSGLREDQIEIDPEQAGPPPWKE
jgi:hypothetical protein